MIVARRYYWTYMYIQHGRELWFLLLLWVYNIKVTGALTFNPCSLGHVSSTDEVGKAAMVIGD